MEIINSGDSIDIYTSNTIYEGLYIGTKNNYLLVSLNENKKKIPFEKIKQISKAEKKSLSSEISKFKRITEGNLIPSNKYTIKLGLNSGELLKLLLKYGNQENASLVSNETSYLNSLMTFHNEKEYNNLINFLKKHNYSYEKIGTEIEDNNTTSPYPKNVHDD